MSERDKRKGPAGEPGEHAHASDQATALTLTPRRMKRQWASRAAEHVNADSYHWLKYGEKVLKDRQTLRTYYKCSATVETGCQAKKIVDVVKGSGSCNRVYKEDHNHPPPPRRPHIGIRARDPETGPSDSPTTSSALTSITSPLSAPAPLRSSSSSPSSVSAHLDLMPSSSHNNPLFHPSQPPSSQRNTLGGASSSAQASASGYPSLSSLPSALVSNALRTEAIMAALTMQAANPSLPSPSLAALPFAAMGFGLSPQPSLQSTLPLQSSQSLLSHSTLPVIPTGTSAALQGSQAAGHSLSMTPFASGLSADSLLLQHLLAQQQQGRAASTLGPQQAAPAWLGGPHPASALAPAPADCAVGFHPRQGEQRPSTSTFGSLPSSVGRMSGLAPGGPNPDTAPAPKKTDCGTLTSEQPSLGLFTTADEGVRSYSADAAGAGGSGLPGSHDVQMLPLMEMRGPGSGAASALHGAAHQPPHSAAHPSLESAPPFPSSPAVSTPSFESRWAAQQMLPWRTEGGTSREDPGLPHSLQQARQPIQASADNILEARQALPVGLSQFQAGGSVHFTGHESTTRSLGGQAHNSWKHQGAAVRQGKEEGPSTELTL